jgi:hypothetical protein
VLDDAFVVVAKFADSEPGKLAAAPDVAASVTKAHASASSWPTAGVLAIIAEALALTTFVEQTPETAVLKSITTGVAVVVNESCALLENGISKKHKIPIMLRYLKIDWFQKDFAPELKDSFDFIMLYFMDCFRAQIHFFM